MTDFPHDVVIGFSARWQPRNQPAQRANLDRSHEVWCAHPRGERGARHLDHAVDTIRGRGRRPKRHKSAELGGDNMCP